jgi:hypothetical protein
VAAAKLRTFLCTPNKTLLALPPVAGTLTRGLARFARILAHVLAPQSLALEGVSLNCVWLYKNSSSTALTCCIKIALAFGGFNFAALTSKVAQ